MTLQRIGYLELLRTGMFKGPRSSRAPIQRPPAELMSLGPYDKILKREGVRMVSIAMRLETVLSCLEDQY